MLGTERWLVDVDDFIPMGNESMSHFLHWEPRIVPKNTEILRSSFCSGAIKICLLKFSFLEIVKMKLENPIYESDPYLADFKPDLDRRHEKMAKTISSIEGKIVFSGQTQI